MKISTKTVTSKLYVLELTKREILDLNILISAGVSSMSNQANSAEKHIIDVIETGHAISEVIGEDCGVKIYNVGRDWSGAAVGGYTDEYDLCVKCGDEVKKLIKGGFMSRLTSDQIKWKMGMKSAVVSRETNEVEEQVDYIVELSQKRWTTVGSYDYARIHHYVVEREYQVVA